MILIQFTNFFFLLFVLHTRALDPLHGLPLPQASILLRRCFTESLFILGMLTLLDAVLHTILKYAISLCHDFRITTTNKNTNNNKL